MPKFYDPHEDPRALISRALLMGMELLEEDKERGYPTYEVRGVSSIHWAFRSNAARCFLRWKAGEPFDFDSFSKEPNVRFRRRRGSASIPTPWE